MAKATQHYNYTARQYNPEVANKIRQEMTDFIKQQLKMSFDNQVQVIKSITLESYKKEIFKLE